jgi:hypothetical protein
MTNPCLNCEYQKYCEEMEIMPFECGDMDFEDPDFREVIYKQRNGEYSWGEVSYNRFIEGLLNYGVVSDFEAYEKETDEE